MLYAVSVSFFPLASGLGIAIILDNFAAQNRKLKETSTADSIPGSMPEPPCTIHAGFESAQARSILRSQIHL